MKLFKILACALVAILTVPVASGQSNASIGVLTQNGGVVPQGGNVFIQVTVNSTGPTTGISTYRVRAQISVPSPLVSIPATGHQLPPNWTIVTNNGTSITVCNATDAIPVGQSRTILIRVLGGPSTGGPSPVTGTLTFGNGSSTNGCTTLTGSLPGDNSADNTSSSSVQVIAAPTCNLTGVTASAGTITCNGGTTTLTATPSGTATAVEYSLNGGPFQSSNTFTVNAAGSPYTVTAREVSTPACSATASAVSVTEPPVLAAPLTGTITQTTCTVATGSVELTGLPAGNWTINPGAITGNTSTTTITGLAPGTHSFTVTNAAGCTSGSSATITINPQPATPAAPLTGTVTQPTCVVSTGSIELTGLPAGNWTINPGAIAGTGSTTIINNLNPGIHSFTVTNAVGCTSSASAPVTIIDVVDAPAAPTYNVVHPTCTVATGTITITSTTTDLTFSLDGAAYAAYPAGGYVVAAGTHTLTAQSTSGCASPVDNIVVNAQPATPAMPVVAIVQPTCSVTTATVTITSSTTGLTFSLNGGAYAIYPAGGYHPAPGNYTLTAQNGSGCISGIANFTVNAQPIGPTATVAATTITCSGGTTTLTVTASGGTGTLEYSLNGSGTYQPANTFTVTAGTYTVTVRDANLCTTITNSVTITQPNAIVATASVGTIACTSGTTTLTVSATGGSGALEYSLNGGPFQSSNSFTVSAGTHTVTVRAVPNPSCTVNTLPVTVTQPAGLTVTATAGRVLQCGGSAVVVITASGGTTPYSSGVGTFTRGPGTWTFTVTDAAGCTATRQITIDPPGCMNPLVYPNPAANTISVAHSVAQDGAMIKVYQMNGALMISQKVPKDAFLTTIDVSKLAAGNYVLLYINGKDKKETVFQVVSH